MEGGNKPDQQTVITNQVGSRRLSPTDWRAKIGPYKKADFDQIFGPNLKNKEMRQVLGTGEDGTGDRQDTILQPLKDIGGIIYPYTPTILVTGQANYNEMTFTHYNYPIYSFMNSTPPVFTVSGPFTANNVNEARYLLAVLNFLKVCIKAQNGRGAMNTGFRVPPVLAFSYLGPNGYDKVPCVIRNYSYQLRDDVDYVPVDVQGTVTYVPTLVNIVTALTPQYTPSKVRRRFDVNAIANGEAYKDGFI